MPQKMNADMVLDSVAEKLSSLFMRAVQAQSVEPARPVDQLLKRLPDVLRSVQRYQAFRGTYLARPLGYSQEAARSAVEALEQGTRVRQAMPPPALAWPESPSPLTRLIAGLQYETSPIAARPAGPFARAARQELIAIQHCLSDLAAEQRRFFKLGPAVPEWERLAIANGLVNDPA